MIDISVRVELIHRQRVVADVRSYAVVASVVVPVAELALVELEVGPVLVGPVVIGEGAPVSYSWFVAGISCRWLGW